MSGEQSKTETPEIKLGPASLRPADLSRPEDSRDEIPDILMDDASRSGALNAILKYKGLGDPVIATWKHPRIPDLVFTFQSMKTRDFDDLQEKATVRSRINQTSQITSEVDGDALNHSLIEATCTDPNFRDAEVRMAIAQQAGFGAPEAVRVNEVIDMLLLPGEMYSLGSEIMKVIGFSDDEVIVRALKGSSSAE